MIRPKFSDVMFMSSIQAILQTRFPGAKLTLVPDTGQLMHHDLSSVSMSVLLLSVLFYTL